MVVKRCGSEFVADMVQLCAQSLQASDTLGSEAAGAARLTVVQRVPQIKIGGVPR